MKPTQIYQKLQEIEEKDDVVELLELIHRVSKEASDDEKRGNGSADSNNQEKVV